MKNMSLRSTVAREAATSAGHAILAVAPSAGVTEKAGRANFVTAADLASEKVIIDLIRTNFPDDAILSEETEADLGDIMALDRVWVIDPIDGTNNFCYGRNYSCVSVGYVEHGVLKVGAIYDLFREELFFAEAGHGAYVNDQKLSVGQQVNLGKATVAIDNSYDPAGTKYNMELVLKIQPTPWVQMKGSAVLMMCEIASGRTDLYLHTVLKPWDNAAGFLLIREAGGVIKGLDGQDITWLSPEAVVGNPTLVEQCLSFLK